MKNIIILVICLATAGLFGCDLVFPFPALNTPQVEDVVDGGLSKRDSTPVDSDAICFQGYETLGESCVDIDECERGLDNCSENAICTNLDGSFECACKDGYEGEGRVCKKPPYCAGNPCQNGGGCTEGEDEVICSCAPGFSGELCETNEDDCTPNPCQNNGTCTDRVASFACTCTAFWEGDRCETNVDECTQGTDNCHETLASCTNIDEGFECSCLPGYSGDGVDCVFGRFPATADAYPLSTSSDGRAVTTGDFDKDGNLDLAIVHDDGYVRVLLGEGDGTFGAATPFLAGDQPKDVIAVDLNGDTSLDLVTANWGSNGGSMASDVSVLLGVGDGTFDAAQKFAAGNTPNHLAVGSFTTAGTGTDFVAVTSATGPSQLSIYLSDGTGSLELYSDHLTGWAAQSVTIGDFDGDGNNDLALMNLVLGIYLFVGDGGGGFSQTSSFPVADLDDLTTGDFNNDGNLDLAVAKYIGGAAILLGDGTAGREYHPVSNPNGYGFALSDSSVADGLGWAIVAADLDEDGNLDLVTTSSDIDAIAVFLGDGQGAIGSVANFGTGNYPYDVVAGDFNNDGHVDIATPTVYSNNIHVFLSDW